MKPSTRSKKYSRTDAHARGKSRRVLRQLRHEDLESRWMLTCGEFPGNDCRPDLDLSGVEPQAALVGQEFVLDLIANGATVVDLTLDGEPTGDVIRWLLDPDIPAQTPSGATISAAGVFRWTPTAEQVGTHEIIVIVVDSGTPRLADAETFQITVTGQAPTLDLNGGDEGTGFSVTFTENDPATLIVSPDLTISDPDSTTMASASARITNPLDAELESLSVDTNGTSIVASYNATTGTLSLTGVDSVENYQAVLRTLRYLNLSENPDPANRIVEVTVNDGANTSNTAISTVSIVSVNDSPDLAPIDDLQIGLGLLMEVTVTATDPEGDTLVFLLDRDDPQSTLPESATIEQIDNNTAVIRWLADTTGTFQFVVLVVDDSDTPGADRETFEVTVVDLSPVLDLNGEEPGIDFEATFTEGDGPVSIVGAELTVTDPDDETLASATVTITNLGDGPAESLAVDTTGTELTAEYNAATGTLSITGIDTLANYQAVLRSLTYNNSSQDPDTHTRIITVVVNDGTRDSATAQSSVTVTAVADPPFLSLPAPFNDDAIEIPFTLGDTIEFTATATDPDTPLSELTFSLDLTNSGISPTAAQPTITSPPSANPGGDFLWTPDETGTFVITIVVTDSTGQSASRSFTIVVHPAARPGIAENSPEACEILWSALGRKSLMGDDQGDVWRDV